MARLLLAAALAVFCTAVSAATTTGLVVGYAAGSSPAAGKKAEPIAGLQIEGSKFFYCTNMQGAVCVVGDDELPGVRDFATKRNLRYFGGWRLTFEQVAQAAGWDGAKVKSVTLIPGANGYAAKGVIEWM
jgi:hypothetical protein